MSTSTPLIITAGPASMQAAYSIHTAYRGKKRTSEFKELELSVMGSGCVFAKPRASITIAAPSAPEASVFQMPSVSTIGSSLTMSLNL